MITITYRGRSLTGDFVPYTAADVQAAVMRYEARERSVPMRDALERAFITHLRKWVATGCSRFLSPDFQIEGVTAEQVSEAYLAVAAGHNWEYYDATKQS